MKKHIRNQHINYVNLDTQIIPKESQRLKLSQKDQNLRIKALKERLISQRLDFSAENNKGLLSLICNYLNVERSQNKGRMSQTGATGVFSFLLCLMTEETISKNSNTELVAKINKLLSVYKRVISLALLKSDFSVIDILLSNQAREQSARDPANIENIRNLIITESLSMNAVIKLLKLLLNDLQLGAAKGEFFATKLNEKTILELLDDSIAESKQKSRRKPSSGALSKARTQVSVYIDRFISAYNDVVLMLNELSSSDKFDIFRYLINLLYVNRGIKSGDTVSDNVYKNVVHAINCGDRDELKLNTILDVVPDLEGIVRDLLKGVNVPELKEQTIFENDNLHITSASGPNGGPALLTLPLDAKALLKDENLLEKIIELGTLFKITAIREAIEDLADREYPVKVDARGKEIDLEKITHSKLFIFLEPGGKWRIVAEVDGFTQTVLTPVHALLASVSREHEEISAQFDQDAAFMRMFDKSQESGFLGTYDLSNATDLLYINLQEYVVNEFVKQAYGIEDIGTLWSQVISTERDFVVDKFEKLEPVRYKYGQPMGAKSSWTAMHLTLIVLAKQAELDVTKAGRYYTPNAFSVNGDDMEFADSQVYRFFDKIINKLNLAVNRDKSFESDQESNPLEVFGEYLKRFVFQGRVFRPISPRMGSKFINQPHQQLYVLLFSLTISGMDFNGMDFVNYSINKDRFIGSELEERLDKQRDDEIYDVMKSLWFWNILGHKFGGIGLPYPRFSFLFTSEISESLYDIFPDINFGKSIEAKLNINKIRQNHYIATRRSNTAILSVFTKTGLTFISDILNKQKSTGVQSSADFEDLIVLIESEFHSKNLKEYPFYKVLLRILFIQRANLLSFIRTQQSELDILDRDLGSKDFSNKELSTIDEMLIESKKEAQMIDIFQIAVPEFDLEEPNIRPLGKKFLSLLEKVGSMKLVEKRNKIASQLSENPF